MEKDLDIMFEPDGSVRFIHDDDLAELFEGEETKTVRASRVEPHPDGGWAADMSPSGGPVLYGKDGKPFLTRRAALAAEVEWLQINRGL